MLRDVVLVLLGAAVVIAPLLWLASHVRRHRPKAVMLALIVLGVIGGYASLTMSVLNPEVMPSGQAARPNGEWLLGALACAVITLWAAVRNRVASMALSRSEKPPSS